MASTPSASASSTTNTPLPTPLNTNNGSTIEETPTTMNDGHMSDDESVEGAFDSLAKAGVYFYGATGETVETWESIQEEIKDQMRAYPQGVPDQKRFGRTTGSIQGVQYLLYAIAGCQVSHKLRGSTADIQAAIFFSQLIKTSRDLVNRKGDFAEGGKFAEVEVPLNENPHNHQYPGQIPVAWFRYLFVTSSQLEPKDHKLLFTRQFKEYCKGTIHNKYLPVWHQLNPNGVNYPPGPVRRQMMNRVHAEVWKRLQPDQWGKYQESHEYKNLKDKDDIPEASYVKTSAWLAFEWLGPAGPTNCQDSIMCSVPSKIMSHASSKSRLFSARRQRRDRLEPAVKKKRLTGEFVVQVPLARGVPLAMPQDPRIEKLKKFSVWQIAYMRDIVKNMHHSISLRGGLPSDEKCMVGRAYTVTGPDIYVGALEKIRPGEVYVQGGCADNDAVFSPGFASTYLTPRGAVGVVVDGGIYKSFEANLSPIPLFSKFVSPFPAINRRGTETIGRDTVVGGVPVRNGDIIMGDADGVIVIPSECEDDLFENIDAFLNGQSAFGKIAGRALDAGIPLTREPALAAMFSKKYRRPESYWREYCVWWEEWKGRYPGIDQSEPSSATPTQNDVTMYSSPADNDNNNDSNSTDMNATLKENDSEDIDCPPPPPPQ